MATFWSKVSALVEVLEWILHLKGVWVFLKELWTGDRRGVCMGANKMDVVGNGKRRVANARA